MNKKYKSVENVDEPIFIVGMARSGTTLLQSILNNHPNIAIPRETGFFYLLDEYQKNNKTTSFSKKEMNQFWGWYSEKRRFTYLGLEKNNIEKNFEVFKDSKNFKNVLDSVMLANLKKNNKKRWGEKTPGHEKYLENIFELYPKAKVIFMIRDPRAIYASLNNVPWGKQFVSIIIKRWNNSVRVYKNYKLDNRIKLINYEELVTNIEDIISELCEFIGEKFDPLMITDRDVKNNSKGKSWIVKHEKEVARKVDNSSIEKWKKNLNKFEIATIENFSDKEVFAEFYNYSNSKFSTTMKLNFYYLKFQYYFKSKLFRNNKKNS